MPNAATIGEDSTTTTPEPGRWPAADRNVGDDATIAAFIAHRELLLTVAREMLGSAAEAEHVLWETWQRWQHIDSGQDGGPRGSLIRILTRQCLRRLRATARDESAAGPWLPESLPRAGDNAELAEHMSMALTLALETLPPTERAVFVLRETFGLGYDEIAAAVGVPPAAVRQIAHRARRHVAVRRPRRVASASRDARQSLRRARETRDRHSGN